MRQRLSMGDRTYESTPEKQRGLYENKHKFDASIHMFGSHPDTTEIFSRTFTQDD